MPSLRHDDDDLETPKWLFNDIVRKTGLWITTDLCADDDNTKCDCYIDKEMDVLKRTKDSFEYHPKDEAFFCNPPRSKNGKFVNFVHDVMWKECNLDIAMLLCWNDLGNKYGEKILAEILSNKIQVFNLGKVIFDKGSLPTKFPSRLTYFIAWFKSR